MSFLTIRFTLISLSFVAGVSALAARGSAQDHELKGFSVIEKVITPGTEPVYQVDGYHVRIVASTDKTFHDQLDSLADIGQGKWLRFAGKRDGTGVLVASKAIFYPGKSGVKKPNATQLETVAPDHDSLVDSDGKFAPLHTKVRMSDAGGWCGWHRIPAEDDQQRRVRRIGMSLVPGYQKQISDDQVTKIHFRFLVVEEKSIRSELACNPGLVLVPKQVLDRLKNDDQVAAVLADGIAFNLQYLRANMVGNNGWLTAAEIAGEAAWAANPFAGAAVDGAMRVAAYEIINKQLQDERARIALSLMADAGYDPWQAPEAWRLLEPKRLPKDLTTLKETRRSSYQLEILNAQYRKPSGHETASEESRQLASCFSAGLALMKGLPTR